jgi:mersacidin/lichenicidin family type 2 lantibiotic
MSIDIVRAWKDPEYRKSLTPEQQASLPENPAEPIPMSEAELKAIVGGAIRRGGGGTAYPDCCYNSTIGPK